MNDFIVLTLWDPRKSNNIKKQPLGGVPKNRCSYFGGYIQIDMRALILYEQLHFPRGQQSWRVILSSKRTGQFFQEVYI